jgi:hypothetical protein
MPTLFVLLSGSVPGKAVQPPGIGKCCSAAHKLRFVNAWLTPGAHVASIGTKSHKQTCASALEECRKFNNHIIDVTFIDLGTRAERQRLCCFQVGENFLGMDANESALDGFMRFSRS